MGERVKSEIELVRQKHPDLKNDEQQSWVLIPNYPLPPNRYNKNVTPLLFLIPVGYPNTAPDDFFVDGDLRLKEGGNPPAFNLGAKSNSGEAPMQGTWGWFSWHPKSWRPAAAIDGGDNLLSFLRSVNMCLRGEEPK